MHAKYEVSISYEAMRWLAMGPKNKLWRGRGDEVIDDGSEKHGLWRGRLISLASQGDWPWCHLKGRHSWSMHAKYEVFISYGSKVIANVKVDNRQTDRTRTICPDFEEDVKSCFLSSFAEYRSAVAEEGRKCFSQSEARAVIFDFRSGRKTQIWSRMLKSYFLRSFVEFCSVVAERKSKDVFKKSVKKLLLDKGISRHNSDFVFY